MRRIFLVVLAVLFCAAAVAAQTKVTGTAQCAKPDPQQTVPVGDRPGHLLGIAQVKCAYSAKPMEIGADKSKEGVGTETSELSGNTSHSRGFYVVTMESGDKVFFTYHGTATLKDGKLADLKGDWGINGGSGKLKGIKGKGTFTCAPSGDGASSCDTDGEYQLPK